MGTAVPHGRSLRLRPQEAGKQHARLHHRPRGEHRVAQSPHWHGSSSPQQRQWWQHSRIAAANKGRTDGDAGKRVEGGGVKTAAVACPSSSYHGGSNPVLPTPQAAAQVMPSWRRQQALPGTRARARRGRSWRSSVRHDTSSWNRTSCQVGAAAWMLWGGGGGRRQRRQRRRGRLHSSTLPARAPRSCARCRGAGFPPAVCCRAAAEQLRAVFDDRFRDPRNTQPERFLWDYWFVPGQYCLVRTQAQVSSACHVVGGTACPGRRRR
jgi:hypothetical protein